MTQPQGQGTASHKLRPLEWTEADCVDATGGEMLGPETGIHFGEICIDSRRISPRDLFVAIKGETHDGHRFAGDVVRKGGRGLLLARAKLPELPWAQWIEEKVTCIVVDDTIEALGLLAAYHRNRNNAAVVAITGSNGKTTTRQMTAAVVSQRFPTLSTRKNFNNNIGLPLTLLELCPDHRWAVVELGMNAPGEIAALAGICRPNIGIITNVAPAHLEGVGSIEGVMHAKGELLDKIDPGGTAVLNADDPLVMRLAQKSNREVLLFGVAAQADIRAESIDAGARAEDSRGFHALKRSGGSGGWCQNRSRTGGDQDWSGKLRTSRKPDEYPDNPGRNSCDRRHVQCQSRFNGSRAVDAENLAPAAACVFRHRENGMDTQAIVTGTKDDLLLALRRTLKPGDWVLVKGSRAMAMEDVVWELKKWSDR